MSNKLFAIWNYDQFPYILGDEVKELLQGGYVSTQSYGSMTFKYKKLYPLKEGLEKYQKILEISTKYKLEMDDLHEKAKQAINCLL